MKLRLLPLLALLPVFAMADTHVKMETSLGEIELVLDEKKAPKTVANFVQYAKSGFYNGTIFHRVIDGFMIQGGGFDANMKQKETNPKIENEAANGLKNKVGTIAMARTNDPHSATSQFFINVADNEFLDFKAPTSQYFGYAVFGKVSKGMDVVNKIAKLPTTSHAGHQDVPKNAVLIKSVKIVSQ